MTSLGPLEPLRGYLQLISGIGEVTRTRAVEAAESLVSLGASVVPVSSVGQAGALAEEILEAAKANRESLRALVRHEVDRAVAAALSGPAPEIVRTGVAVLAAQATRGRGDDSAPAARSPWDSDDTTAEATSPAPPASRTSAPATASPMGSSAKKTSAKKATPVKKASATKAAPAKKASATKAAPAKKASATRAAPAKKASTTEAAPAKKATATKAAPAKKASTTKAAPAKKATTTKAAPAKKASTRTSATTKAAPAKKASATTATPTAPTEQPGDQKD